MKLEIKKNHSHNNSCKEIVYFNKQLERDTNFGTLYRLNDNLFLSVVFLYNFDNITDEESSFDLFVNTIPNLDGENLQSNEEIEEETPQEILLKSIGSKILEKYQIQDFSQLDEGEVEENIYRIILNISGLSDQECPKTGSTENSIIDIAEWISDSFYRSSFTNYMAIPPDITTKLFFILEYPLSNSATFEFSSSDGFTFYQLIDYITSSYDHIYKEEQNSISDLEKEKLIDPNGFLFFL